MTLQSSGSMTMADINTEMGRASGASLDLNDSEMLIMLSKQSGDPITIPDDFYGKSHAGTLQGTYTVTLGGGSGEYGYISSVYGSINSTSYRAATISSMTSKPSSSPEDFRIVLTGSQPTSYLRSVYIVEDDYWLSDPTYGGSTSTEITFIDDGNGGPWPSSAAGETRTVKLYGV